jgi:tRNA A-37 threonylcarbamoyl transferase component Bud32
MDTVKMNPPMPAKCPQCGTPLPLDTLAGLCPACLLKAGAAADTISDAKQPAFQPPTVSELAAKFPQLEIIELIGKGGMGAVYKARQTQLDRYVALKILPPGIGDDPAFAERFAREAKALAKLNHPGIVTIYDFGRTDGLFYFFMEYVDGVNLRQLLHAGRVSPREALAIVPQICDALQFAHDQGIVHRDIKPENILMDRRGRVKVADFGLAKIIGGDVTETTTGQEPAGSPMLTESGKVMGTPQYMAPEQKEHPDTVDHRADIYALGVVFYQMLTGELPGKKIEPPSSKVHIDVRLDEVVLRALEKKPNLRYQQASVLKTEVETIATGPAFGTEKPRSLSSVQNVVLTVGNIIAAVLLLVLGWFAVSNSIFFNVLYFFVIFMGPLRCLPFAWNAFFGALEWGFWRDPFSPAFRKYRWQLINRWLFWILAVVIVEICLVPPQFTPAYFKGMQIAIFCGAALTMLWEMFPGKRIHLATNLAYAFGSLFILTQIAIIYWPVSRSEGVVLSAPFRGEWLVLHGGQSSLINAYQLWDNQREALAIERLVNGREQVGSRDTLASFPSWNETIFAPADGTVTEVENALEDCPVGEPDTDNPAGNHVVVDFGGGHYVMMEYFKKGSLLVAPGDRVHAGQPIGLCGNSGFAEHPQLGIQVQNQPKFLKSNLKTFPIFFTNVTCVHSGRERSHAPFSVRRNDHIISQPAADESDFIGQVLFPHGDRIQISSVERDDTHITVKGRYELLSRAEASLALYITGRHNFQLPDGSKQKMQISKGRGDFELVESNMATGSPHVSMYADGHPFATVYFGTKSEAATSDRFKLDDASPPQTAATAADPVDRIWEPNSVASIDPNTGLPVRNAQAAGSGISASNDPVSFGPAIERVINLATAGTNYLIRFTTGELRTPPVEASNSVQGIYQWGHNAQMDAAAGIVGSNVLTGFDLTAVVAPAECWDDMTPAQAVRRLDVELPASVSIMAYGNALDQAATCVFKTRDGGIGILQVTEQVSNPPGLKLRYKFLNQVPAAMHREANVTNAEWSPALLPGEKPNLQRIRDEIGTLMEQRHYEEALQRQLWYFNHSLEFGESDAIRTSFGIMHWGELGRRYPKARQAMIEIRDADARKFSQEGDYPELFSEIQSLNRELNDDKATLKLFHALHQQDRNLAAKYYFYVEDLLMQQGEYALCLNCIGDPQARFESARLGFESQTKSAARMSEITRQHPMLTPRLSTAFQPPDMGQMATNNFVGQVCKLVEILVATGHKAGAEKIRDQAVAVLDDSRLKSTVSDAEEKIRAQNASSAPGPASQQ